MSNEQIISPPVPMPPQAPVSVSSVKYAGFCLRAAANFIDCLILLCVQILIVLILGNGTLGNLVSLVVSWGYVVFMVAKYQATFGKMLVGLRIERTSGEKIGFDRAFLREIIGKILSSIILGIGYIMVVWTKKNQGLHDKVADTVVVEKDANKSKTGWIVVGVMTMCIIPFAIVGILSSLVLVSLGSARVHANDAAIKADIASVVAQAELYAFEHQDSYGVQNVGASASCAAADTLFTDPDIQLGLTGATQSTSSLICSSSNKAFMIAAKLSDGTYWCVDSTGKKKSEQSAPANTDTVCP